jgi:hypothetical protein
MLSEVVLLHHCAAYINPYRLAFVRILSTATGNFHSSVTVEAQRHVYTTFLSVEVLRKKIAKY